MDKNIGDPKVTVLMPVYNGAQYLHEAIDSILNQTFADFEFLIINDGSTDGSLDIIKSYNDNRIKLVNNETNLGIVETLNKGIKQARGKYIARMDCDDISMPERLEKQVKFLEVNPEISVVASHIILIDKNGKEFDYWKQDMETRTVKEISHFLAIENCIAHPTVMMDRSVVSIIGYNKRFKNSEDWALWLILIAAGYKIAKLDEIHLKYRIHTGSISVKHNLKNPIKNILRFKRKYLFYRAGRFQLHTIDYDVLKSYIKGCLRYYFYYAYIITGKLYSTHPVKFAKQYFQIQKILDNQYKPISHIFFFPFALAGGAEKVHASILETVIHRNPVVLITSDNVNSTNVSLFPKNVPVISIRELLNWPFTKNWLIKKINSVLLRNREVCLFGSNSVFFYRLLSKLPVEIKAIDLMHAFMHPYEDGAEKWSLPVVNKLRNRIVVTHKTADDIGKQYLNNNILEALTRRIVCINNFTPLKTTVRKDWSSKLTVLYVGRGTTEKRVDLISHSAKILSTRSANIEFHFVGNVEDAIPEGDKPYCILHGEVSDVNKLDEIYSRAHILLMTSSREGFPVAIMEAMMNGVVPISTPVGGITEHIKSNYNGVLLKSINAEEVINEIVNIIEYFISHREVLSAISENAHNYAIENFDKKRFLEAYQGLINS